MKSKTILVAAIIALLGLCQVANAQVTFGVKVGLNVAKEIQKSGEETIKAQSINRLYIGGNVQIPMSENLYFEPGVSISGKGGNYSGDKYVTTYLDIPINLLYKFPLADDINLVGSAGPYAGLLLSAKEKSGDVSVDAKDDFYKSLDFGLNLGIGAEISQVTCGIQYGIGLANISPADATTKNMVFSISVGYRFGSK